MFEQVVSKSTAHRWYLVASELYPDEEPFIDWLKLLPRDVGTKHQRAYLLRSTKSFLKALINMPGAKAGPTMSHATIQNRVRWIKRLLHWMIGKNLWRFSQLKEDDLLEFLTEASYSIDGKTRVLSSIKYYITLFRWMWDLRFDYQSALRVNPAAIEFEIESEIPRHKAAPWKALDESVALPLIRDALQWIEVHGALSLRAVAAISDVINPTVGLTRFQIRSRLSDLYKKLDPELEAARGALEMSGAPPYAVVRKLLTQTQGACLIALLFLIGFRCRELVNLNVDSMILESTGTGQPIYRLGGVAAKRGGLKRTWVASPEVVNVVAYMTRFHAQARNMSGQKALFMGLTTSIVPRGQRGAKRLSTGGVGVRIKQFADAPHRKASPKVIRLHPHSARKTFARFVVLRDKRALEPLSYHFGHTQTLITDGCYVGYDIELEKLIDYESRRDLASGLEDILRSGAVAGKAAENLRHFKMAGNTQKYRGRRSLQRLIDRLIEQGVQLAPCDWGYCVYSQSLSACRGDITGPNEVNRSPSVCAGCKNFTVTEKHRAWWSDRLEKDEDFLRQIEIAPQSRGLVEKRIDVTKKVLTYLNESRVKNRENSPASE